MTFYATFDTPIGVCALAWNEAGVRAVQLPSRTPNATVSALLRVAPDAQSAEMAPWVKKVAQRIARHLSGSAENFEDVALDLSSAPDFYQRVYEKLRSVPSGKTLSYGELAKLSGSAGASRAVGQAMAKNPVPILVPCHRVLGANGRPGGFSAPGGVTTKEELLEREGVKLRKNASLFEGEGALPFDPKAAVKALKTEDPIIGAVIEKVGPLGLQRRLQRSPFESLAESIMYQQLHARAAERIHDRVLQLFPRRRMRPELLLTLEDAKLRAAGLSQNKLLALKDLSAKAALGVVPSWRELDRLSDEEIIERLTTVRGIGTWTVQMLLIFRMGRPDVLPVDDFAVRKAFGKLYRVSDKHTKKRLLKHGEKWRPFRSAASWYLWRSLELD